MSIEANKAVAREFFGALNRRDGKRVLELYAEDGVCWTAGNLPFSGTHTLEEMGPIMAEILGGFPDGLKFTLHGLTAEGDRVAIEAESYGEHKSGKIYNNRYHFLMILKDGRIKEFREYMDTLHAEEVLVMGKQAAAS